MERTENSAITSFDDWAAAMTQLVDTTDDQVQQVTGALAIVDRVLAGRAALDLSRFTPGTSSYARHLIHRDPDDRFCLLVLVWKPGQGTPIHDHSGTWGVYGVLENRIRFVNYTLVHEPEERLEMTSTTVAVAGSATTVLPPHCDIHRMENPSSDTVSMTLHAYGKEVLEFNIFQPASAARRPGSVTYDSLPC